MQTTLVNKKLSSPRILNLKVIENSDGEFFFVTYNFQLNPTGDQTNCHQKFFRKTSSAIENFVTYNTFIRRLMKKKIIPNTPLRI